MANVITRRVRLSRRFFLKGVTATQAPVLLGLPPLVSMFNSTGTAYAAETTATWCLSRSGSSFGSTATAFRSATGFPTRPGRTTTLTPCLSPLARLRDDVHVLSGLDNSAIVNTAFDGHATAMSGVMTCTRYSGRGPCGPSIDQVLAGKLGSETRFRSLQVGVSQESLRRRHAEEHELGRARPCVAAGGDSASSVRPRFRREGRRVDQAQAQRPRCRAAGEPTLLRRACPKRTRPAWMSISRRCVTWSAPSRRCLPTIENVAEPGEDFDMKDWPRVAKIQSDLLAYALATRQTRIASYMLTKCQGLARFPWLGHTAARHHDYTHKDGKAPGSTGAEGQRILRDICRWHVDEFAYLVGKLKSIPEGDGTVLDNTLLVFVHEHAEANIHKASGMIAILAGSKDRLVLGRHTRSRHVRRPLSHAGGWRTECGSRRFPTATKRLPELLDSKTGAGCQAPRLLNNFRICSAGLRLDRPQCQPGSPWFPARPGISNFSSGQRLQRFVVHIGTAFQTQLFQPFQNSQLAQAAYIDLCIPQFQHSQLPQLADGRNLRSRSSIRWL